MKRYLAISLMSVLMNGAALDFSSANSMPERPDLPPPEIVAKVLEESPAVQSAKSGIALGQANRRKLVSGPYEFNVNATGQQREIDGARGRYDEWSAGIDRPFRIPGKRGLDTDIGNAGMNVAQLAYGDAYHEAARTLLAQWFDWVKAKSEVAQWQTQAELFNRQRDVVARREKLGDAAKLDASTAQAASMQAEASLKQAEGRLQIAASVLMQNYPGLQLPENIILADPAPIEGSLEEWRAKILSDNHELEHARAQSQQVALQADRARLDLIPDPTVGMHYGSDRGGDERYMGVRVSVPLPGSGGRRADSQVAQAQAAIAAQQEALTYRNILNNIATVHAAAVSGYSSWQSARLAAASIDQNAAKMTRAYELGEIDLTDLLTALRLKAEVTLSYNTTRIEAIEARYRLLLDAHQLWQPREEEAGNRHE